LKIILGIKQRHIFSLKPAQAKRVAVKTRHVQVQDQGAGVYPDVEKAGGKRRVCLEDIKQMVQG